MTHHLWEIRDTPFLTSRKRILGTSCNAMGHIVRAQYTIRHKIIGLHEVLTKRMEDTPLTHIWLTWFIAIDQINYYYKRKYRPTLHPPNLCSPWSPNLVMCDIRDVNAAGTSWRHDTHDQQLKKIKKINIYILLYGCFTSRAVLKYKGRVKIYSSTTRLNV